MHFDSKKNIFILGYIAEGIGVASFLGGKHMENIDRGAEVECNWLQCCRLAGIELCGLF